MNSTRNNLILVTGGNGKTGRRVVERLDFEGIPVRVGSREGDPPFDWNDRTTWAPAVRDVTVAYLAYFPDLAVPGAAETVGDFAALAVQHGVRRLVLLSGRGEPEAQHAEELVKRSGAEWTVVRCSWFNQNFDESQFAEPIIAGELALPASEVRTPFVDAEDIADVAFAALTQEGHAGETYVLTGPRRLSFAEVAAEIAEATGRPVAFVPITIEEFTAGLTAAGVPEDEVGLMRYLFTEVLVEENSSVADGVERALGRQPRDFRDFARHAAAAGAWEA